MQWSNAEHMTNLAAIVGELNHERDRIERAISALERIGDNRSGRPGRKRRTMSAEARAQIAAAQRELWAFRSAHSRFRCCRGSQVERGGFRCLQFCLQAISGGFERARIRLKRLVGERGFEPPTPWSRT